VLFGTYCYASGATLGAAGSAWSTANAFKWRVRKVSASSPVGFSKASYANGFGLMAPAKGQYQMTVTSSIAGWATVRANGIYYQDQDGNHRLRFNINGTFTSKTLNGGDTLTITGVTFKNVTNFEQACSAFNNGTVATSYAFANPNASTVAVSAISSLTASRLGVSGDVELESAPSWV
jgi:hypothetical protein